ncbi:hypothetical protein G7Y89_g1613 [Cudoniella acicularis]|uniref:C2H2-type domain-containing protein n=1 Tax=Cudoniella acicularis TaxID=354080 RepID=A0A8H4W9D8_9HELO|nr:hypothetical protein G7Y89_g1613 [Cudoniella acicularis]
MEAIPEALEAVPTLFSIDSAAQNQEITLTPPQTIRHGCDITSCLSTFKRPSDLSRHKKTIHGPKEQCIMGCGYATARLDKMVEHTIKKHNGKKRRGNKRTVLAQAQRDITSPAHSPSESKRNRIPKSVYNAKEVTCEELDVPPYTYPDQDMGFIGMEIIGDMPLGNAHAAQGYTYIGGDWPQQTAMICDICCSISSVGWP